ncbi:MAG TPA: MFS transporter [Sphingomonas sp.]|nr:MFS transporter [Sphingomonas sp.]
MSITVIGDLYAAHERGKVQGWLASVWGVSSVIGPLAGGLIIQHVSWAWIFWINVPIGLAAAVGFFLFLRERVTTSERSVDVVGAGLFTVAIASLMVALTEAGASDGRFALLAAAVCFVAAASFVVQERRARDPMVAFALWTRRAIATTNGATLFSGMAVIGLTTFADVRAGRHGPVAARGRLYADCDGTGLADCGDAWRPQFWSVWSATDSGFRCRTTASWSYTVRAAVTYHLASDGRSRFADHGFRDGLPEYCGDRAHPGQCRVDGTWCCHSLKPFCPQSRQHSWSGGAGHGAQR